MGTYLRISLRGRKSNKKAKELNGLWKEFSNEEKEKDYLENFYDGKCGYTLNFFTEEDLDDWAKDAVESERLLHLGIGKSTSIKKAKTILKKVFPFHTEIGHCEIKLSGNHYCWHSLKKVKDFIDLYGQSLGLKVDGYEDLKRFINYKEKIITSRYCTVCKELAEANNIPLPIFHGGNSKSISGNSEFYNNLVLKIDAINEEYTWASV